MALPGLRSMVATRPTVYESGKRIADRELEWWKQVAVSAWSFINGTEKEQ